MRKKLDIWEIIEKDMRKSKDLVCSLDLLLAQFYFAGQFGQNIPVDEGRRIVRAFIEKIRAETN